MTQTRRHGDAGAPIVCTITRAEIPSRIAQLERMREALDRLDRTEHGLLLRFPNEPAVEADVRRFAIDEKSCCGFWGFEIGTTADEITLRWDGPPGVAELLDRLHTYFLGDQPLTAVAGLL